MSEDFADASMGSTYLEDDKKTRNNRYRSFGKLTQSADWQLSRPFMQPVGCGNLHSQASTAMSLLPEHQGSGLGSCDVARLRLLSETVDLD